MPKSTAPNTSRRAFLSGAGGLAASLAASPRAAAQPKGPATSSTRDRGLWATWYDLRDAGRSDHLAWVHERYIPGLLGRPGYLWAAHYASIPDPTAGRVKHTDDPTVAAGSGYILVVGAEDTNVFGNPAPAELQAALPRESVQMLAMRIGERTNVFAEAARVTGPGAADHKDGMTLAPCIQFGTYSIETRQEADILAWYAQLQMPNMAAAPGCVRTRKLASVCGWAKMGILYEFASVDLRNQTFASGRPGTPHKWQGAVRALIHAPGSPNVARRIWPPSEV